MFSFTVTWEPAGQSFIQHETTNTWVRLRPLSDPGVWPLTPASDLLVWISCGPSWCLPQSCCWVWSPAAESSTPALSVCPPELCGPAGDTTLKSETCSDHTAALKHPVKLKSECNLLPHTDVFLAKMGLKVKTRHKYWLMFTVANRAECALCPPSAPADNIAVCEYTEQYNRSMLWPQTQHC